MAAPITHDNCFRVYDQCIYDWLDNLKINYGSLGGVPHTNFGILRVFASPDRAYATMETVLIRKGFITPETAGSGSGTRETGPKTYLRVPQPFASILRGAEVLDESRWQRAPIRKLEYNEQFTEAYQHRFPQPLNIPYTIEFWCAKHYTISHIKEWLWSNVSPMGMSKKEIRLTANFGSPWGDKIVPVTVQNWGDNSDLEPGEQERELRVTLELLVKGWLFLTPTAVPTIIAAEIQRGDLDSGEIQSSQMYFDFNLAIPENWNLMNTSGNSILELGDNTITYIPGDGADYIYSAFFPTFVDTYKVDGYFTSEEGWNLKVISKIGGVILSKDYPPTNEKLSFEESFSNSSANPIAKIEIRSTGRVDLTYFAARRVTYNP